jgi:galactoside 2-L-fucosyltransferase 1/2
VCLFQERTVEITVEITAPPSCPTTPIVTVVDLGGRLGNQVWEYADVWGLARMLGRPGYMPNSLLIPLQKVFANLSLRSLEEIKHCNLSLGGNIEHQGLQPLEALEQRYKGKNMQLKSWIFLPKLLLKYVDYAQHEFQFRPEILQDVKATVERVGGKNRTRIGIHVRRTDYVEYLLQRHFNSPLVERSYFQVIKYMYNMCMSWLGYFVKVL